MFRVVPLEDWTDVMYIQMYGSDAYPGYQDFALAPLRQASKGLPVLGGALYFVSFVLPGTVIMLNLFIGVIINSMDEAQAEREAEEWRKHNGPERRDKRRRRIEVD